MLQMSKIHYKPWGVRASWRVKYAHMRHVTAAKSGSVPHQATTRGVYWFCSFRAAEFLVSMVLHVWLNPVFRAFGKMTVRSSRMVIDFFLFQSPSFLCRVKTEKDNAAAMARDWSQACRANISLNVDRWHNRRNWLLSRREGAETKV